MFWRIFVDLIIVVLAYQRRRATHPMMEASYGVFFHPSYFSLKLRFLLRTPCQHDGYRSWFAMNDNEFVAVVRLVEYVHVLACFVRASWKIVRNTLHKECRHCIGKAVYHGVVVIKPNVFVKDTNRQSNQCGLRQR